MFEGVGIAHADPIRSDGYHLDVLHTLARWVCCMLSLAVDDVRVIACTHESIYIFDSAHDHVVASGRIF